MNLTHHPRRRLELPTESLRHREHGYVMVTFALLLIPMLLMVGLSVDVGRWYSRTSDIQKAADAAALAGVVWLPDLATATTYAKAAAKRNGFEDGVNGVTVKTTAVSDTRLRVTITDPNVGSFFWEKLGGRKITLSRKGTAEYVLPVPLGSPENKLGNNPVSTPVYTPNLWASISAPYTDYNNGDPYSTKCGAGSSGTRCSQTNAEYRTTGYLYIVDVPQAGVGQSLNVQVYDAGHYARSNYPNVETADNGSVNTSFEFFKPDNTPLDIFDGLNSTYSMSGKCTQGSGKWTILSNETSNTYKNNWQILCRIGSVPAAGQYVMQVKTSNIPGVTDAGDGWNQFSIQALSAGTTQPALYTTGDLSLFNNLPNQTGSFSSTFYLTKVLPLHAGKTLQVSLFDPGDGTTGTYYVNVLGPGGTTQNCTYTVRGGTYTASNPCKILTRSGGSNAYNGKWLDIRVAIPTTYNCTTDCWWKVRYDFNSITGNGPNDRTVWAARVIGDPVHLVEE